MMMSAAYRAVHDNCIGIDRLGKCQKTNKSVLGTARVQGHDVVVGQCSISVRQGGGQDKAVSQAGSTWQADNCAIVAKTNFIVKVTVAEDDSFSTVRGGRRRRAIIGC